MNVRTRVSVLMNSVRILLDLMSVYLANLDTKHREECVTVRIHTHIYTHANSLAHSHRNIWYGKGHSDDHQLLTQAQGISQLNQNNSFCTTLCVSSTEQKMSIDYKHLFYWILNKLCVNVVFSAFLCMPFAVIIFIRVISAIGHAGL